MRTVVIGGKGYPVCMKFGALERLLKNKKIEKMNNHNRLLSILLRALAPNRLGIKPFYTLRGIKNAVEIDEMEAIDKTVAELISFNRDSRNPTHPDKRSIS